MLAAQLLENIDGTAILLRALVAAPGAAIVLAVWGFNMLGEGLRDALDPHEA